MDYRDQNKKLRKASNYGITGFARKEKMGPVVIFFAGSGSKIEGYDPVEKCIFSFLQMLTCALRNQL